MGYLRIKQKYNQAYNIALRVLYSNEKSTLEKLDFIIASGAKKWEL